MRRAGFTLIELLVVIGLLVVLLAMLLPGFQRARDAAYDLKCQSNLRQIGTAWTAYAVENGGYILPLGYSSRAPTPADGRRWTWFSILVDFGFLQAPTQEDGATSASADSVLRCPKGLDQDGFVALSFSSPRPTFFNGLITGYWRAQSPKTGRWVDAWYAANGSWVDQSFPMPRLPQDGGSATDPAKWRLWRVPEVRNLARVWIIADGLWGHASTSQWWGINSRHGKNNKVNFLFGDGHVELIDVSMWASTAVWNATDYNRATNNTVYPNGFQVISPEYKIKR
jgi:prepilin-type processing-associated H-X9-DG protein/prepilin-type N-terminal cleavage/methylation domain-containing protein